MRSPKKRSKTTKNLRDPGSERQAPSQGEPSRSPTGIDNRNESTRRYGGLEPEGYTRHLHGNREGEFQSGGKAKPEMPVEEGAPMKDARFRHESDKRAVPSDQFGGRTRDDLPGDHDIIDDLLKKPPA
jgi:hypothetical protein